MEAGISLDGDSERPVLNTKSTDESIEVLRGDMGGIVGGADVSPVSVLWLESGAVFDPVVGR